MYENRFPEVEEVVMVNVKQIAEMGAYVHLMEYNNIEGIFNIQSLHSLLYIYIIIYIYIILS